MVEKRIIVIAPSIRSAKFEAEDRGLQWGAVTPITYFTNHEKLLGMIPECINKIIVVGLSWAIQSAMSASLKDSSQKLAALVNLLEEVSLYQSMGVDVEVKF